MIKQSFLQGTSRRQAAEAIILPGTEISRLDGKMGIIW
jgi:hypothetical protein